MGFMSNLIAFATVIHYGNHSNKDVTKYRLAGELVTI